MKNSLEKNITFLSLIKITLPTVIMMVFFSLYTVIDGMFVSRFVNSNALSAVNIVMPIIWILSGIGVMFATGGSAIVAKYMGEEKIDDARDSFSLITLTTLVVGCTFAIVCFIFIKDVIKMLGGTSLLYDYCHSYLSIILIFAPFLVLKMYFDYFLVTAGAPTLGLIASILGGVINISLDYIFIVKLDMGIYGAGLATSLGNLISSSIGIVYFLKKKHLLHFVKPKFNFDIIKNSCLNGSSEMVTQLSSAVTTFLYNIAMIKLLGEDGVASITIILYVQFLLNAIYLGFTSGVAPRISYNYGSNNVYELKKLVRYSYIIILIFSITSFVLSNFMSETLISSFTSKDSNVFNISLNGFNIFSIGFLVSGFNIFTCGMFTAFSNGKISAILSIMRTFILFIIGIIVLPQFLGVNGIWLIVPFTEFITLGLSILFVIKYSSRYMYGNLLSLNLSKR